MIHREYETVEVEKKRIVGKWETYTETEKVIKCVVTTCDICGKNDNDDKREFGDVTVEKSQPRTDIVYEFHICDDCWPALVAWVSSHHGAELSEYERYDGY